MDTAPPIDPQSTRLVISNHGIVPSDRDGWRASGECIGSHKKLQELTFYEINTSHENLEALLTGVNQNRTVRELGFFDCHGEWPLGILEIFFRDNQNLSLLRVYGCRGGFIGSLSASLRGCTSRSLQHIDCGGSGMGDEDVTDFIEVLAGLPQLKKLKLYGCDVRLRGCGAVTALLQRPACMLQEIWLSNNGIGDEGFAVLEPAVATNSTLTELSLQGMECSTAALQSFAGVLRSRACMLKVLSLNGNSIGDDEINSFADALAINCRLEQLILDDEHTISDIGFAAMTRALCNTSSIGGVHSSNHTLQDIDIVGMPYDLCVYLSMNSGGDKSLVARKKIFMHFFEGNFSMGPFHENNMPQNVLPHLLSWIGRMPDGESITALFNFFRRMREITNLY